MDRQAGGLGCSGWVGCGRSLSLRQSTLLADCPPCTLTLPCLPRLLCCHVLPASLQYEFKHRLLAFLYAASRSPLGAPYPGSSSGSGEGGSAGLVELLEQRARTAVVGSPTYLSDAGSDSWREGERGAYSPTSQLSDWEGEDEAAAEGEETAAAAGEASADAGAAAAAALPARQPLYAYHTQQQQHLQQAVSLQQQQRGQPRRESPYSRTSLSVWLASKASGGLPASLLDPRLCFHERELVQQVGWPRGSRDRIAPSGGWVRTGIQYWCLAVGCCQVWRCSGCLGFFSA